MMSPDGTYGNTRVGPNDMDANFLTEDDSFFSKNLSGLPAYQLTLGQNVVAVLDDLVALVQDDEAAVFECEGLQKGFFHDGKERADRYWRAPKPCVFPGCTRKSIRASHTLQRGGPLALVAQNQHVLTPGFDRREGTIIIRTVGIGEASTFPGFCDEHERLFDAFEAIGQLKNDMDVALQVFRSVCREVVNKRAIVWQLEHFLDAYDLVLQEHGMKFMEARLGSAIFTQLRTRMKSIRIQRGSERKARTMAAIEMAKKFLHQAEQNFLAPSHAEITGGQGGLSHFVVRVSQTVPVCLAGTANLGFRTADGEKDIRVFVNVWPSPSETVIAVSCERSNGEFLPYYINEFAKRPLGLLTMIETWMVRGTDHWFVRPSVWNDLPTTRQGRILSDLGDTSANIGEPYSVSIFDEIRRDALASEDVGGFAPEMLQIEARKLTNDK